MSKSTTTANASSRKESRTASCPKPPSSAISEHSPVKGTPQAMRDWLTSLVLASHVNPIVLQGEEGGLQIAATSGLRRRALLALYDPASFSWRMCRVSSKAATPTSGESSRTFAKWVMWDERELWELEMSERLTDETDGGAWPTCRASDGEHGGPNQRGSKGDLMLPSATVQWSTPSAAVTLGGNLSRGGNRKGELLLQGQAKWMTASTRDWEDGANPSAQAPPNSLLGRQAPRSGISGPQSSADGRNLRLRLNPLFVEWLIGWPIGWTDLKPLATDRCPSAPQAPFDYWLEANYEVIKRLLPGMGRGAD